MSLSAVGHDGQVVGCLIINDTPPVGLLTNKYGSDWLKATFNREYMNTCNTLFIQLFVIQEDYKKRGFIDFIKAAFRTVADVNHLLFLVPKSINLGKELAWPYQNL